VKSDQPIPADAELVEALPFFFEEGKGQPFDRLRVNESG
jgi:hypothetical protein